MKRFSTNTIIFSILMPAAIAFRALYLWQFSESPLFETPVGPDVEEYNKWAREILAAGFNSGKQHIHAPLYPALLAALYWITSFKMIWVRLLQTLLVLGGFGICALAVKKFVADGRRSIIWIFMVLAAFYPPLLFYSSELICETLLLPLICMTIALLYWSGNEISSGSSRKGLILTCAAGICAGLAAITHPASLIFIALETVLLLFITKGRLRFRLLLPVLFLPAALLIIAPVCIKNSINAKHFVLIQQNSGFNFYLGNNPNATGTCYIRPGKEWRQIHEWAAAGAAQRRVSKDKFLVYMSLRFIWGSPLKEMKLLLKKAFYVWNFRELPAGADASPILYFTSIVKSSKYMFILLGSLCICGILLVLCKRATLYKYRHFIILILACWAAQTVTTASGRYRLPMYPAFFIFAAFASDYIARNIKKRPELLKSGTGLLAGALIVTIPSPPANPQQEQAETASLYGEAYFHQGKYAPAAKHLQTCLEYDPANSRAYNLLGTIAENNSPEQALQYYQLAIKSEPQQPEGYLNFAIHYSSRGKLKEAGEYFTNALRYGPYNPQVLYNYACFMHKQGKHGPAEEYLKKCLEQAPWHDKALNMLGVLAIQAEKPEQALRYLSRAHRIVPGKTGVMRNLAVALYLNGKRREAVQMLQKVAGADPGGKAAETILRKWQAE